MKTIKTISILVGTIAVAVTAIYFGYCLFAGKIEFPGKPLNAIQKVGAGNIDQAENNKTPSDQPPDRTDNDSNETPRMDYTAPPIPPTKEGVPAGYLRQLEPIQCSGSIHDASDITCRGTKYCYSFLVDTGYSQRTMEFNIGGDKTTLTYGFGYDDEHPTSPGENVFAVLEVLGDGVLLSDPITIRPTDPPVLREVSVKDVFKLTFIVTNDGSDRGSNPCILDPKVT